MGGPVAHALAVYVFLFVNVVGLSYGASGYVFPSHESSKLSSREGADSTELEPDPGKLSYKQISGIIFIGVLVVVIALSTIFYRVVHSNPQAEAAERRIREMKDYDDTWESWCSWWPWTRSKPSHSDELESAKLHDPLSMQVLSVSDVEENMSDARL